MHRQHSKCRIRGGTTMPIGMSRQEWLYIVFLFSAVVVFGSGIHYLIFRLLHRQQNEARRSLGISTYLSKPARAVFLTIGLLIVLPYIPRIPLLYSDRIAQSAQILLVLFLGWLAVGGVYVLQSILLGRFDTTVADNLRARSVHTQMQFFRRQ